MSGKKKILLFTDWYEPGFKAGGPIQSCKNIVNNLASGFEFWIFTSDRDLGDHSSYQNVQTNSWITLNNGAHVWYASPDNVKTAVIRKVIDDIIPDIIYLNSMFSSGFSLLPLWILRRIKFAGRIILAPRGMLNTSAVSRKKWKKKIFLALFAFSKMSKKIIFHATDRQEEKDIKKHFNSHAQVYLIENIPNLNGRWVPRSKQPGQVNCVFISRIHPIKNLLYAINVAKNLAGCTVWFDIYGTIEDEKYFQACREEVSSANPHIHINFKGPVANSGIFAVLENYHMFFLPTQGENFGHVIFEALTSGCIVLISNKTPWNDVEKNNAGWALPLANNRAFAEKLKLVCNMDERAFNEMSQSAFNYAKRYYTSTNLKKKYTDMFNAVEL